jgi:hypothetical protein
MTTPHNPKNEKDATEDKHAKRLPVRNVYSVCALFEVRAILAGRLQRWGSPLNLTTEGAWASSATIQPGGIHQRHDDRYHAKSSDDSDDVARVSV